MRKRNSGYTMTELLFVIFWFACVIGYVINVYQVVVLAMVDAPLTAMFIIRVVGLVVGPLGCVLGYIPA